MEPLKDLDGGTYQSEPTEEDQQAQLDELAELLEGDEDLEVSLQCNECCSVFTGSADHLIGADGCPTCGSEDLEVI
jgi:Zn finger protein HypA/HybF involved in hydrogenase expression